jgi:ribulose kinase
MNGSGSLSYLIGVDFGTSGVRVGAFNPDTLRLDELVDEAYPTEHPHPGWAEQHPEDWWNSFRVAIRKLLNKVGTTDISAITVATTSSTVVVASEEGKPLRPAILWMDARADAESRFTGTIDHPVMRYSGGSDAVEWLVPKAIWLANHEPEIYRQADRIVEAVDFINFRLTHEWTGSKLNATCKWNYDPEIAGFHPDLFEAFGVGDLMTKLPDRILPVGSIIGTLLPAVASDLGITSRPLIVQGGIDAHTAMLGSASIEPGRLLIQGGTSVVHLTQTLTPKYARGIWGPYPSALLDGYWLIEGGQVSGGSILSWLAEKIFELAPAGHDALIQEAMRVPPCSSGLLTLDYWMGNRTPYRDAKLRGTIMGLSLFHDRACMYRSAVESIALGTKNVVDSFETQGIPISHVVVAGGIRNNPLWLETLVDVLGRPVHLTVETNLSILAGAIAGTVALGIFPTLEKASKTIVRYDRVLEPNAERHEIYAEALELYRQATAVLTPILHQLEASTKEKTPVVIDPQIANQA